MNRYTKIIVAMFLMIFTFVSTLQPLAVQAATKLADGEYSIGFKVLKDTSDEESMMNQYSVSPGTLKVKDGKKKVSFTLTNSSWITKFETEKAGKLVATNVISEDKEKDTRVVEFDVEDIEKVLNAKVKVDIDFLNYHHEYDVRIAFDQNSITPIHVEKPNEKEDPANKPDPNETTDPGQKPDQKPDPDQQPNSNTITDGTYSIPFKVLKDQTDEESKMNTYMVNPGVLKVENGKKKAIVTLKSSSLIKNFQTEKDGAFVDAKVVSEDKEKDTRVVEFEVNDLSKKLNTKVFIEMASRNYKQTHDVQLLFEQDKLEQIKNEEKQPEAEKPEAEKPEVEKPDENKKPDAETIKDGEYSINFKALKDQTDEISMMNTYTKSPGVLKVKDGKKYVSFTLTNSSWITKFEFEKNGSFVDAHVISEDKKADTRVVEVEVPDLSKKLNAKVKVDIDSMNYHHFYDIQFAFDKGSIKPLDSQGGNNNQGGNDNQGGNNNQDENNKPRVIVDSKNLVDGQYDITFKVLKDKTDEISKMHDYVVNPAKLIVKDGKKYIEMTLKNSAWITKFQAENNELFADAKVVSEDKNANTRVVQFEVEDLFKKLNAKVKVDIDEMNYHHFYDVQIQFDTNNIGALGTIKEEPKNEPKNPVTTPKVDNVKTVGTPDFNRNADGQKKKEDTKNDSKKEKNSKTADTAQLGLYMVLLLGSLALLVRKYRAGRL
ncbi:MULTISPECIES: NEAT domain-containing protein [Bacillus cereus group]|uniref:NEAT domain-containing protein n=1 Tax=Bacillus cereus group TaxID=86661 RepID=UPI00094366A4|nr:MULTISPECIES: NEAT domain-containing protein [Bacillus cereus group]MCC3901971.1 NEAT domain-containing protein [Bacillus thuringiensis]MCC3921033.1 NEAT domain-containing protein [Bacillus thuringiensis]MCC3946144.1 NEAT domain-containing protein [Bacillus thuringiensis]MCC3983661.1 NEAT domain-containing protein [Bacillus thuringiensis]MDR4244295.1 sortase B protein-sorting domain-containing protein [Bacillus thuringiensis]